MCELAVSKRLDQGLFSLQVPNHKKSSAVTARSETPIYKMVSNILLTKLIEVSVWSREKDIIV